MVHIRDFDLELEFFQDAGKLVVLVSCSQALPTLITHRVCCWSRGRRAPIHVIWLLFANERGPWVKAKWRKFHITHLRSVCWL